MSSACLGAGSSGSGSGGGDGDRPFQFPAEAPEIPRDADEITEWLKGLGVKPQEHHDDEHDDEREHHYD